MGHVALGRDDFMRVVFEPDFFDANPNLVAVQPIVTACKIAYSESAARKHCRCGGDPRHVFGCLDATLELIERLRGEKPEAVQQFVSFVGVKHNKQARSVTIYYRKTSIIPLRKIKLP